MSKIDDLIAKLCPNGMEYKELQELFFTKNGYTPSTSNKEFWENGTIPWFKMEDIRINGKILNTSLQKVSASAIKSGKLFPKNSIIIATSATIGEHALITVPYIANQRFTVLAIKQEFSEKFDIKFIFYYCFKLDVWCCNNITTSSFASVDMNGFKKFKFPVPPLEIQQEIVKVLDTFTQLEAELEAELEARRRQYHYYRDHLLNFEGRDDVQWMTLGEVCESVSSGGTPLTSREDFYNGDIPWLRTQEVNYRNIKTTEMTITEEGLRNSSAKWIPPNTVIIAMYGATAAKVAINDIPLTTNQACCNLVINKNIAYYRYVFHWISREYQNIKNLGEGSQSNINTKKIKNYPITIPSLEEQARIVAILDKFDALVNDLSSGLPAEIAARRKQYEYYRDRLLTFKEAQ